MHSTVSPSLCSIDLLLDCWLDDYDVDDEEVNEYRDSSGRPSPSITPVGSGKR